MLDSIFSALTILMQFSSFYYIIIGTLFGMICGMIPGLSGVTAMIFLIPLTYIIKPDQAILVLTSAMGGSCVGGSITSILVGIPGAGVNAATMIDGFPLAKKGRAGEAIGASASSSALGGIFGALVLIFLLPVLRHFVLLIGPPEIFMMTVWGLTIIGTIVGRSIISGLISVCIGLILSSVGFNPVLGGLRYTFGLLYLWDGVPLPPSIVGFFAILVVIELAIKGLPIAPDSNIKIQNTSKQILVGIMAPIRHLGVFLRGSALGTFIGLIPGVGGVVASFLSYGQTVKSSKDKSMFGRGDIRGVVGPESSNNSSVGGAMIPTLTFGVPGSAMTAILLVAFMIHGIRPGPMLFKLHLNLIWVIILTLIVSNILASVIACVASLQLVKITHIPPVYLVPIILILSMVGSYSFRQYLPDVLIALIIGLFGYIMKRFHIPIVPAVIAFILGSIMERTFFQTLQMGRGSFFVVFLHRPIALAFTLVTVVSLIGPFVFSFLKKRRKANLIGQKIRGDLEMDTRSNISNIMYHLILLAIFIFLVIMSIGRPGVTRNVFLFPLVVLIVAIIATILKIIALVRPRWGGIIDPKGMLETGKDKKVQNNKDSDFDTESISTKLSLVSVILWLFGTFIILWLVGFVGSIVFSVIVYVVN